MAMPAAAHQEPRGDAATAIAVLRQRFGERLQTGAEIRRQHANVITWIPNQPPDAVIWVESTREVRQVVEVARTYRRADRAVRRRHLAGGAYQRAARRAVGRLLAHEPDSGGQRARPRLRGGARRLAQAAQRLPARHGAVLPHRSGRRGGHHRRHGVHARLRHHRRALRHHARERAERDGGDGRRLGGEDGAAGAQVGRRLRPDAADGGLGGHARHPHRADRAALRHPRPYPRRRVPVRDAGGRLQRRDPGDPGGARGSAHGDRRRRHRTGRQQPRQAGAGGEAHPVPGVPRHRGRHPRPDRDLPPDRRGRGRASASTGPSGRRTATGCGRRATTSTGR